MTIIPVAVPAIVIDELRGLDRIHVYLQDVGVGQGHITIICYGKAWTVYFGAMGDLTIAGFFLRADVDYLLNKMYDGPKKGEAYFTKIVLAVREALAEVASR